MGTVSQLLSIAGSIVPIGGSKQKDDELHHHSFTGPPYRRYFPQQSRRHLQPFFDFSEGTKGGMLPPDSAVSYTWTRSS
jgi:hypothetical protein